MEIGQTEITEVKIITNDQERNIELMKKLFPKNAQIEPIGEPKKQNYRIRGVLDDSPLYEGGQEIELEVYVPSYESSLEEQKMEDGWIMLPFVSLKVKSFLVNGEQIVDEGDDITIGSFGGIRNENPDLKFEDSIFFSKREDRNIVSPDAFAYFDYRLNRIVLFKMCTGANLAGFFHEKGHLVREDEDISEEELGESNCMIQTLNEKLLMEDVSFNIDKEITGEQAEMYRKRIYEERRANIKSLKYIRRHNNLFPNDPDLSKLKNLYVNVMTTYLKFQKGISRGEVVSILDFEQDWHY